MCIFFFFFFYDTSTTEIYTLSLHDALPIFGQGGSRVGEEPLAETRLAISAQRTELERTADQLRDALDLKKRFGENPALFVGLGAGAVFLIVGGPVRVARLIRRRVFPSDPEKAYD